MNEINLLLSKIEDKDKIKEFKNSQYLYFKIFSENFCSIMNPLHEEIDSDKKWQHLSYFMVGNLLVCVFAWGNPFAKEANNKLYINIDKKELPLLEEGVSYESDSSFDYVIIVKKKSFSKWKTAIPDCQKVFKDYWDAGY